MLLADLIEEKDRTIHSTAPSQSTADFIERQRREEAEKRENSFRMIPQVISPFIPPPAPDAQGGAKKNPYIPSSPPSSGQ